MDRAFKASTVIKLKVSVWGEIKQILNRFQKSLHTYTSSYRKVGIRLGSMRKTVCEATEEQ